MPRLLFSQHVVDDFNFQDHVDSFIAYYSIPGGTERAFYRIRTTTEAGDESTATFGYPENGVLVGRGVPSAPS
jgi:hypothetical protein